MCGPSRWMVTVQRGVWPSQTWSRMSPTNSRSRPGLPRVLVLRGRGSLPLSHRMEVSPILLTQMPPGVHFFCLLFGRTFVSCFEIPFYPLEDTIEGKFNMSVHWNCKHQPVLWHIFHSSARKAFQRALEITFWEVISPFSTVISSNIDMFPLKLPLDKILCYKKLKDHKRCSGSERSTTPDTTLLTS